MDSCFHCSGQPKFKCQKLCGFLACDYCGKGRAHTCSWAKSRKDRALFDKFYQENKGEKLMLNRTYDINIEQLNTWSQAVARSGSPPEIVQFAATFTQHLLHVSFSKFHLTLNEAANETVARIMKQQPIKTYLMIDGSFRKSNTWVALLAWQVLSMVVTDVITDPTQVPEEEWEENIAVIHLDDMSYSGKQMGTTISAVADLLNETSKYYILVPFMGTFAKYTIGNMSPHLQFLSATNIIKNLDEYLSQDGAKSFLVLRKLKEAPWDKIYGAIGTQNLIYFDHKLADVVSIPSKMFAGLYVLDGEEKVIGVYKAIRNCENAIYKTNNGQLVDASTTVVDFDDDGTCPVAFYKTIPYTFNGKLLKDSEITLLEALSKV